MPRQQLRQLTFRWIETYYNCLRRNIANGGNKREKWIQAHGVQVAGCTVFFTIPISWLQKPYPIQDYLCVIMLLP